MSDAGQFNLRQRIKSIIQAAIDLLLRTRVGTKLYNRLYEISPHRITDLVVRLHARPDFDLMWVTRLMNGKRISIQVRADNPRSWEFAHSYRWHEIEIRNLEYALLRRLASEGLEPIFLDIGANMGLRSLLPLSMDLQCFLFEPNPELRDFTTSLFALNDFRNFEIHNVCLSDRAGAASFYVSTNSYLSSLDRDWLAAEEPVRQIEVSVSTLDEWISSRPELCQRPSLIKIDVEGAELRVLEGARRYIARERPLIICEIATKPAARKEILHYCRSQHYQIFRIRKMAARTVEILDDSTFICLSQEMNFLLVPVECSFLADLGN